MEEFEDAEEELPPFDDSFQTNSVPSLMISSENSLDISSELDTATNSTTNTPENSIVRLTSTENSTVQGTHSALEIQSTPPPYQFEEKRFVGLVEVHTNKGEIERMENGSSFEISNHEMEIGSSQEERNVDQANVKRGLVDTRAPFESVKEAVTKFGGIVDWKAHRAVVLERRKHVQLELEKVHEEIPNYKMQSEVAEDAKAHALLELDGTKRLIEELKLNLEKAQTEEAQAKEDSELAQLRAKEMEQGITDEASTAAKTQLEVASERHRAAISELKSVQKELEELQKDYISLLNERDNAVQKAEEAFVTSKEIEKTVEDLTLDLIVTKEYLESAHAVHLEAEEHRIDAALARDQDYLNWEKELKQAEQELGKLSEQVLSKKELGGKLDSATSLLLSLESELAAFIESKLDQEESGRTHHKYKATENSQNELQVIKASIEKAKDEVNILRVAESSLKSELKREKAGLVTLRRREGMTSGAISFLEDEIEKAEEAMRLALTKEKDAQEKMAQLPNLLQKAGHETELAKADAESAREELREAKDDTEQAKACLSAVKLRLSACFKEIEAAKASEKLALLAAKAVKEREGEGVTLPLEEYYTLSKRAQDAEEHSNELVTAAIGEIEVAKELELKTLERLEEAHREMEEKKEALRVATENAERAKEGKLGMEQELRVWRAEHEARRRSSSATKIGTIPSKSSFSSFESETKSINKDAESSMDEVAELKSRKKRKKKKSLFPRIVMFLARKNAETL